MNGSENHPFVSVVTPVYNGAEFLEQCIESVIRQTHGNFEYIVVNNCSKDNTLEIARKYAARDNRIRVHDNGTFLGVIANHNLAFSLISPEAKYCKVVSADDWILPECLEKMVGLAEAHPNVGMVGSYSVAGKQVVWDGLEFEQSVINGHDLCRATLLGGPYVFGAPTSLLYRANLLRKTESFYPNSNPHADTSACYATLQTADFGFVHQILSYTRVHSDTQTSSSLKSGKFNRALISDLVQFGPVYLSKEEREGRLQFLLDQYYEWFVPALADHSFSKEFVDGQNAGLEEIGLRFSTPRVLKAVVIGGLKSLRHPRAVVGKILALRKNRGKVTARYY